MSFLSCWNLHSRWLPLETSAIIVNAKKNKYVSTLKLACKNLTFKLKKLKLFCHALVLLLSSISYSSFLLCFSVHYPEADASPNLINPILRSLHWLPVRRRIVFKTAVHVWKCIHRIAPAYLQELCTSWKSPRSSLVVVCITWMVHLPRMQTSIGHWSSAFYGSTARFI